MRALCFTIPGPHGGQYFLNYVYEEGPSYVLDHFFVSRPNKVLDIVSFLFKTQIAGRPVVDNDVETMMQLQTPTWGKEAPAGAMKATWLGRVTTSPLY